MKDSLRLQKKVLAAFQKLRIYYKPPESADFIQQPVLPLSL